jgi:hypothetical protein
MHTFESNTKILNKLAREKKRLTFNGLWKLPYGNNIVVTEGDLIIELERRPPPNNDLDNL